MACKTWLGLLLGLFAASLVGACIASDDSPSQPSLDSESHFLRACETGCGEGLSCVCGVCTIECGDDTACVDQHAEARCVMREACAGDIGAVICDLECAADGDCAGLGDQHSCVDGACRAGPMPPATGCLYEGLRYAIGERFPDADGCNTCTCEDGGGVSCTERACAPMPDPTPDPGPGEQDGGTPTDPDPTLDAGTEPVGCTVDGTSYAVGESFDAADGCNTCTCSGDGQVACTERACVPLDAGTPALCELPFDVGECDNVLPVFYFNTASGQCEPIIYGGCGGNENRFDNRESCVATCGGSTGVSCLVDGTTYASGDGVPDPFSCNQCSCGSDGSVDGCTEIACPEPCPQGSAPGIACNACGPADECLTLETGCLPACTEDADCDGTGYLFCLVAEGHCTTFCG